MVGERRNGNLLVSLGPKLQAYPEELIRQRCNHDGYVEYLIRWSVVAVEDGGTASGNGSSADSKAENILMWMSAEDVYANCPTLLGKRKHEGQNVQEEKAPTIDESHDTLDELVEMKKDVRALVKRARNQLQQMSGPGSSTTILHTIHVLSAYASIGSLVSVFKETGALDLLMKMLCNEEKQIRRSAGKMLRALASHDAGSRAYVLLSLSQQDGIEQHMDFENRYTLLELFAETTSSEEHCISFEGIHLPQIPGKLLFSLVKRYLCVTSLMDSLNNNGIDSSSKQADCSTSAPQVTEQSRIQREFEFTMAMANLISDLVRVMGWDRNQKLDQSCSMSSEEEKSKGFRSIFQPRSAPVPIIIAPAPRKKPSMFKTRSDFSTRSSYVEYVQDVLKAGMAVRMLESYEQVNAGDEGEFRLSNDGTPPVQVYWHSLGRTYWVHWHMIEIIGLGSSEEAEKETQEKASNLTENLKVTAIAPNLCKPLGGLYTLPYLTDCSNEDSEVLNRAEWWEVLFFIKKLEPKQQQDVITLIRQSMDDPIHELDDHSLVQLSIPMEVAYKVMQYLNQHSHGSNLSDLHCSHIYIKHFKKREGLGNDAVSGLFTSSSSYSSCSSGTMGSVSKKPKKEILPTSAASPTNSANTEKPDSQIFAELQKREELKYPEDIDEKLKALSGTNVAGKKGSLEKFEEVVELMKKSPTELGLVAAGLRYITRVLEEEQSREKLVIKVEKGANTRDKLVKMLVEILTSQLKEKVLVVLALRLVYVLMSKYEWRVSFATEGGISAVLACMQEYSNCALIQWSGLTVLKVLTGAGSNEFRVFTVGTPLADADAQVVREIFASIGSASSDGTKGLLCAIPSAVEKMLNTPGCSSAVQDGLLVVHMMIQGHKTLVEQLVGCDIWSVLRNCLTKSDPPPNLQHTLALIIMSQISGHKIPTDSGLKEPKEALELKDMELKMCLASLKEMTVTKELILALERRVCDEASSTEVEILDIMKDREIFQILVRNLDQQRQEKTVQQAVVRILNKFLDNYAEDVLPWHECIEPCLSSMTAYNNDREVLQEFLRFLFRLATTNKDYAVVMCRLGTKEALAKALEKHSSNLLLISELRDLISDCEKYASLYKQMTTSILAGCIQMVLGQIEEHRRSHQPINIPFFDVFLRNLCQGSTVELKEDKCWEKIEVSSNHHRASKLTDRNPRTYWESNGSTGSHFINIYMQKGVVIRHLALLVASEDSSYMPARVVVMGGDDPSNINTELNTVNVPPTASRVVLLENVTRSWPVIQIRIKRCQQGGIDTRVHGFEILGPKPTFWPVFKEQLCRRTYLFYTTKAHTWCQEINEDRTQLLQLFNKLNSALRHEQMFADRFLPDAEAAESLGKTCWEALINPIVHCITSSDSTTLSPLSWLLSEYFENSLGRMRCRSHASIFNSRVRRLCHLLVHVDTSRVETEDLKPHPKSDGKETKTKEVISVMAKSKAVKPSSLLGITECWQGVVRQQVKKFLESYWNDPVFVKEYCNTYAKLKNAMEELFGFRTAFVLALRKGFSAALLQLSFLTAMHVSELFARYIDERIQESSCTDSSNTEALNQLQVFLEPMLFLSGLELANSFEHFYRYYLGDRLLVLGKTWLERSVVEQIGLCFPNHFPQQMLKNLSESEELQQEFHLYRLQQFDKYLEDEGEEQEMQEDSSVPEQETNIKIVVLSPRCWVIPPFCHMDNPAKYFPSTFASYLQEFAEFYTNSQGVTGLGNSKPRRLQWTWLGSAVVQYESLIFHVTTLQMYILLQFNEAEEVSVKQILESTGLSPILVNHALKPLVQKKILVQPSSEQSSYQSTVLILNSAMPSVPAGHLLPKQTYRNVEEDAASVLERKRNVIRCLIIQIMKAEGELHIDNLVFRVLEACQKCESKLSEKFFSFGCSNTDVLSCVIHLINQGYIQRNEDSPHILEYVSKNPATPRKGQAYILFRSAETKKSAFREVRRKSSRIDRQPSTTIHFGEEGALDAVLFPMGRTMSQEEVRQLMSQTVSQVKDALNVSSDEAQHLLIHCKWNVDLLIQSYLEDQESLLLEAGLKVKNPAPSSNVMHCPVCLMQLSSDDEQIPTLCCMHYCCKTCWKSYLTTRIEQNLALNCTCPITDCPAQPMTNFILKIIVDKEIVAKYNNSLLRGYVECCSNLTWCTNPQGCDQILCKEGIGNGEICSKCSWLSCFNCNFPEAHYPASCIHMSQWMDDGGFYEGMTVEAQSKHLAKLISKRCPSCQAQIEKNEGCLHMTCAKCNHGFCWRCLKPWKPNHKDYYNCSAMVSKAARQEKKFHDYNERCTFQHQAREFAINLRKRISSIAEAPQMKMLTFVVDACTVLEQARKVLAYSCVYSYYNQDTEKMDVMEQQTENLEIHTNALQILLEETLLKSEDLTFCLRLLKSKHLNTGMELIRRIQERLQAILQHSTQDFRVGYSRSSADEKEDHSSNLPTGALSVSSKEMKSDGASSAGSDVGDTAVVMSSYEGEDDDDDYVPDCQDYDEDDDEDIDDDDFSYDEESENLATDSFFFEEDEGAYD
ncbi:cullin-9 [Protopterus annectens]|uniref:cullin-9 n=1 Tax=Protopterus annectens TaxID=7888 RepID=UPI001CFAE1DE|nr:cullin-9 [Protopterus annectens]XP_043916228.1 cullin-9 [Protopterus annectens]